MITMKTVSLLLPLLLIAKGHLIQYQSTAETSRLSGSKYGYCSNNSTCPTWFTCNSDNRCMCENSENDGIICDNVELVSAVLVCYCVTYDRESGSTFVGLCFYNCEHVSTANTKGDEHESYDLLPQNPEKLINDSACTHFHRKGLLCGDCEEGHSPLVLSYNLSCIYCPNGQKNWWKFILAGFFPLTLFYLFVILFNINVTSSLLHGVVWASQVLSMPAFVRIALFALESHNDLTIGKVFVNFFSYWNLEFFRSVLPDICLNVTTLQALALEYLIALYPFVLIAISHLTITLYSNRTTSLVSYAWRPFQKLQENLRKSWDVHTSVIDSFSTFFLLSYVKILSVTSDILTPTRIQQLGSNKTRLVLYYSPSVLYFGDEHLPYAILALIILTVFAITPTVIFILYPCQSFQKFLSLFPINWHFLHAFVDSFQGCYKDGTEPGTFDCRWFSVITLIIQPVFFIIFSITFSIMHFIYALVVLLIVLIMFINVQPYKNIPSNYPPTDLMFFCQLSFTYVALLGREYSTLDIYRHYHTCWIIVSFVSGIIPIIYICYLIGLWLFSRRKWIICK